MKGREKERRGGVKRRERESCNGRWENSSPLTIHKVHFNCFTAVDRASSSSLGDAREVRESSV